MGPSTLRVIVTGLIAQHPLLGGMTWHYLNYVLGLRRLGHDVYYVEDSGQWPYNVDGGHEGRDWIAKDCRSNVQYLGAVFERYGLGQRWAYRFPVTGEWFGLTDRQRYLLLGSADILINVSGSLEHPERYRRVPRLAYIDTDPVFTQLKLARSDVDFSERVKAHDVHFSFGEYMNENESVPPTPYTWQPTHQPVVLGEWLPDTTATRNVFTTVMSWTSFRPLTYRNQDFGQKDIEFLNYLELPGRVAPVELEVALGGTQHPDWRSIDNTLPEAIRKRLAGNPEQTPAKLLAQFGWRVVDPLQACSDLDHYRNYIRSSMAEWSVAKNGYVVGHPGWFSCRSACYLASGRPVVVQDTGFTPIIPTGDGLLVFRTVEQAAESILDVHRRYEHHAQAARDLGASYFDSDTVLSSFLERV